MRTYCAIHPTIYQSHWPRSLNKTKKIYITFEISKKNIIILHEYIWLLIDILWSRKEFILIYFLNFNQHQKKSTNIHCVNIFIAAKFDFKNSINFVSILFYFSFSLLKMSAIRTLVLLAIYATVVLAQRRLALPDPRSCANSE